MSDSSSVWKLEVVLIDPTHMTVFEGIRFPTKSTAPSLDGLLTRGEIAEV